MGGSHRIPNIGKTGERVVASSRLENGHESVQFCTNRVVTPLTPCRPARVRLACHSMRHHAPAMFIVSEEAAAAIRTAYEQEGELSAAVELRRLFPGITDNVEARKCARTIAGWQPRPAAACQITPSRLRRSRARPTKP